MFIYWPTREELKSKMPECFKENFGLKVTLIIDCFEVFIERASNLEAQCSTWSNYKHHNTIKILIGICPQGSIVFISQAYGGRISDKVITEHSGILDNLLPGDVVLADRGFLIAEEVQFRGAILNMPAFLKGKKQLSARELEETRSIANVRIHVERVIGTIRRKFTILHSILPVSLLRKKSGKVAATDKIILVCCALTNLCPSVV